MKKRNGLSVIEIVLSLIIITVSVTVVFQMFLLSESINDRTRQLDTAVFTASSILSKALPHEDELLKKDGDDKWSFSIEDVNLTGRMEKKGDQYDIIFFNESGEVIYEVSSKK